MIRRTFQEDTLGLLGFGAMRLPVTKDGAVGEIQVRYALAHGVNYFDTAYPYHGGELERVIGRALREYPRESYHLATKYPGHQIAASCDPAAVFEDQLEKCGVGCGRCARICPQGIDIPQAMREFAAMLDKLPKWADICRRRDEAQKR